MPFIVKSSTHQSKASQFSNALPCIFVLLNNGVEGPQAIFQEYTKYTRTTNQVRIYSMTQSGLYNAMCRVFFVGPEKTVACRGLGLH